MISKKEITLMVNEALTRRIIGCAMQVHRTLGNGFQEVIYQRALSIEFELDKLQFVREQEMPIYYREGSLPTGRQALAQDALISS